MKVIVSHTNLDFDGLACLFAAKKLYPDATVALTEKQQATVKSYLAIYRDTLDFSEYRQIPWEDVSTLILVDVASLKRTGIPVEKLPPSVHTIVYDHHAPKDGDLDSCTRHVESVGAAITILVEQLLKRNIDISPFEATLFGLGLYTDTGNFTYPQVTARDLYVGAKLIELGMDVALIEQFSDTVLSSEEKQLFQTLLQNGTEHVVQGLTIFLTSHELERYQGGLATLTKKLLETTDVDAAISIVKMRKDVYVVTRAQSPRIDFRPLVESLGGGGHAQAASATIKRADLENIFAFVAKNIEQIVKPAVTARTLMASPVKYVSPTDKIEDVLEKMFQFGHTGFPVVDENGTLVGVISRRDVDKATHHGLGHAPVKAYMSTEPVTLTPDATLEEVQMTMMTHNIGRIPIVENGKMIGILTRTDVIEQLHQQAKDDEEKTTSEKIVANMRALLPPETFSLLKRIGAIADEQKLDIYLIGGIVRDFFLNRPNEDIDIVVEGDGVAFAKTLQRKLGGDVTVHDAFQTATWTTENDLNIDIVTCRTEYYEAPGELPTVVPSNIREDLKRRDFTINAMALRLNESAFGELLDYFQGERDLKEKKIRILHTLSFIEDPTRIFRAVRFALRFGYELTEQTERLAIDAAPMLRQISAERIYRELEILFAEGLCLNAMKLLDRLGVWQALFAVELTNKTSERLRRFVLHGKSAPFFLLTALVYGQRRWEERLKPFIITVQQRKCIEQLRQLSDIDVSDAQSYGKLHDRLHSFSDDALSMYALLIEQERLIDYVKKRQSLTPLLTGHDLKKLNIEPGPHYATLLRKVASLQLDEKIATKEEALQWIKNEV